MRDWEIELRGDHYCRLEGAINQMNSNLFLKHGVPERCKTLWICVIFFFFFKQRTERNTLYAKYSLRLFACNSFFLMECKQLFDINFQIRFHFDCKIMIFFSFDTLIFATAAAAAFKYKHILARFAYRNHSNGLCLVYHVIFICFIHAFIRWLCKSQLCCFPFLNFFENLQFT